MPRMQRQQAQQDARNAEALTVIYSLWWATMPAMMKGYIHRVLARGFAYEARDRVARGLMQGKRCVLITLSGSPLSMLLDNGEWKAMNYTASCCSLHRCVRSRTVDDEEVS
jgi:NAD(P)H dehydrogenase (quinone)